MAGGSLWITAMEHHSKVCPSSWCRSWWQRCWCDVAVQDGGGNVAGAVNLPRLLDVKVFEKLGQTLREWAPVIERIIEKVGPWSIFSRPKNGSTSLQNSLFEHNAKSRSASKRRKTAQLRSKTASSIQHNSVLVVTSQLLRGYFAVTSRSQRGCYAVATVTTRSLRGYYGHYAVTTVTTQSERAHIRD